MRPFPSAPRRRRFLKFLGASALFAACNSSRDEKSVAGESAAVPAGMPGDSGTHAPRERELRSAWQRAQALGKPLLVVLVPESDAAAQRDVSALFGGLLNHGTRDQLALLGLTELACATRAEVERVTGADWKGEPLCVLVDGADPVIGRAVDAQLDAQLNFISLMYGTSEIGETWEQSNERLEQNAKLRSSQLADAIRLALVPDATALQKLTARARSVVPASNSAAFAYLATCPEGLRSADALDYAALVHAAAAEPNSSQDKLLDTLAAGVRERWVRAPVPGSYWASSTGCGQDVEYPAPVHDKAGIGFACGMGHTPEYSQRFLYFYDRDEAVEAECK
ncbi:MAG: hypothetical protein FJ299_16455 [Planctomycetes bacterium]|nr:hypothetical protein [Planctomycetota bacterium]